MNNDRLINYDRSLEIHHKINRRTKNKQVSISFQYICFSIELLLKELEIVLFELIHQNKIKEHIYFVKKFLLNEIYSKTFTK